jgi:pilus assembly protein CpaF
LTGGALPLDLLERVRARLVRGGLEPSAAHVAEALRDEGLVLGDEVLMRLVIAVRSELSGAGPLEPLLRDDAVSDVLVNGPDSIWLDRGAGLERTEVSLTDEAAVRRLAQRLAALAGRRLDEAAPYVDARLPDGSRLHAVIPPVAPRGTCISIRVPRRRTFTLAELVEVGSLPAEGARWLQALIEARVAFLVSGGTGAGKTTLLSCLLSRAPADERLLIVEDSSELDPAHPHVVRLESRPANVEGAGAVTLRDLVRQALRMRPDRLVVGEVRGAEVVDLLAALNTGHEGGCGTVHANSATDVPARLEALALAAGLPRPALHAQLAAGLDAVVHVGRLHRGIRMVREVCVLRSGHDQLVQAVPALVFNSHGVRAGPGLADLAARLGPMAP